jgi:hypothetical protein
MFKMLKLGTTGEASCGDCPPPPHQLLLPPPGLPSAFGATLPATAPPAPRIHTHLPSLLLLLLLTTHCHCCPRHHPSPPPPPPTHKKTLDPQSPSLQELYLSKTSLSGLLPPPLVADHPLPLLLLLPQIAAPPHTHNRAPPGLAVPQPSGAVPVQDIPVGPAA